MLEPKRKKKKKNAQLRDENAQGCLPQHFYFRFQNNNLISSRNNVVNKKVNQHLVVSVELLHGQNGLA